MKYQIEENCLTIFLPKELDHHQTEEIRREADRQDDERNHVKYVIFDSGDKLYGQLRDRSDDGAVPEAESDRGRSAGRRI